MKDEDPLLADYSPATVPIDVDLSQPNAAALVEEKCNRYQAEMLDWADGLSDRNRLRPRFNALLGNLCELYVCDPYSGFAELQDNTKASYLDSIRIIQSTIGERRIDRLAPIYFKECYFRWKESVNGGAERTRRAYGCIQLIKIVLSYGVAAHYMPKVCDELLRGLSKMRFAKNPPRDTTMTFEQAKSIVSAAMDAGDVSTALVQALQFECFMRQIDIIGKWRTEPGDYVLEEGEVRCGNRVWRGMTIGMIVNDDDLLRVRTSKTAQFVAHALGACELVQMCLGSLETTAIDRPVACQSDGSPWPDHRKFGKHWRVYADLAAVPRGVWNMDNRASGITEATGAGASHDDLAANAAHASKTTTRKIYMRGARESSERVQNARKISRKRAAANR